MIAALTDMTTDTESRCGRGQGRRCGGPGLDSTVTQPGPRPVAVPLPGSLRTSILEVLRLNFKFNSGRA